LLAAIASEPEEPVAAAAAVELPEHVPPETRDAVVGVAPEGKGRNFAALRSRELGILDSLCDGRHDVGSLHEDLGSWSNWLQLRAAGKVTDERILAELARSGRAKRVRRTASGRLRLPAFRAVPASAGQTWISRSGGPCR
jgi:hypothetical protein